MRRSVWGCSWALVLAVGCGLDDAPESDGDGTDGAAVAEDGTSTDGTDDGVDDGSDGSDGSGGSDDGTDDGPQPAGPDNAPDPSTDGPYPVGVRTFTIVDDSRGEADGRPLVVEVWYPATEAARDMEPFTYTVQDILRPEAFDTLTETPEVTLETAAVRDADIRADDGPFPIVMFSHGSGGIRMQSTHLVVPLASHGYVVVAPDHYGNTLSDILLDGDLTTDSLLESLGDRTLDLDFVVEHLQDGGEPEISDVADFDRMGVAGHSFGALTTVRWIGKGADVKAAVAQAPPPFDIVWLGIPGELAEFDVPLQLHVGGMDLTTPPADADSVWAQMSAPGSRMDLADAGHFTFSDICGIDAAGILEAADLGLASALEDGCTEDNTEPEAAFEVIRNFAIGHFNVHLRDSDGTEAFLTEEVGRELVGDELTFEEL